MNRRHTQAGFDPSAPTSGCERAFPIMMTTETRNSQAGVKPLVRCEMWRWLMLRRKNRLTFGVHPRYTPCPGRPHKASGLIAGTFFEPPFPPMCVEDGNSRARARGRGTSGFKDYLVTDMNFAVAWRCRADPARPCGRELHNPHPDPGARHPGAAGRARLAGHRPDRHRQDRGLRAAAPAETIGPMCRPVRAKPRP